MKSRTFFLFITLFSLATEKMDAQKSGYIFIDSVLKELPHARDSQKIILLNILADSYRNINIDSGNAYAEEALKNAFSLKWEKGEALCYNTLGTMDRFKAKYPEALNYYFKALGVSESLNDKAAIAGESANIGVVFQFMDKYEDAMKYEKRSLNMQKELGNRAGEARQLGDIATLFWLHKQYDSALAYDFNSLGMFTSLGKEAEQARTNGNIGMIYGDAGNYVRSLEYNFKSLNTLRKIGNNRRSMGINYSNIGYDYLIAAQDSVNPHTDALIPKSRAEVLRKARAYLDSSIFIARKTSDLYALQESSKNLAEVAKMQGDFRKAFESYKEYSITRDSIFSTENKVKIAAAEATHELKLKDKQIQINTLEIARKQNEKWVLIIGIALLTIISILLINRQRLRQKKLQVEKENAEMAKTNAESELVAAQKQLDMFRQSVLEKNNIIEQITKGMLAVEGNNPAPDIEMITRLEKFVILTDEQWDNFKELFEKVHRGFFTKLRTKLPELSQAEIRFLALTKLNLSAKEMAAMLGISPNAIRMYRYRLRKKLELDKEEMIEELIRGL